MPAAILALALLLISSPPGWSAGCQIQGRVSVSDKDGSVVYGDWIRVLLVARAIDVNTPTGLDNLDRQQQYDRMISAHIDFYKKVQQAMGRPGYLVADTLTRPDGTFGFYNQKPGDYQVVVTFPAMIDGYKVAWQVPVSLREDQMLTLELNRGNMLLPTYRRE